MPPALNPDPKQAVRRIAFAAAGGALAVAAAGILLADALSLSGPGRFALLAATLLAAAGTAFLFTVRLERSVTGPARDLTHSLHELQSRVEEAERTLARTRDDLERTHRERTSALEAERSRLLTAQETAHVGDWDCDVAGGGMTWSGEMCRIFGLKPGEFSGTVEACVERLHPSERAGIRAAMSASAQTGAPFTREVRIVRPDGDTRDLFVWGHPSTPGNVPTTRMVGAAQDITDIRRAERELAARARDLERSNADLEQFAYAASHDLQEPLRMVASYVQLLARRYKGKLDKDADEFIAFAVDGAERMQRLIRDLLTYSRVTRMGRSMESVDLAQAVRSALANLKVAVEESAAAVTCDPLPVVKGDATAVTALFQNLLGNAIKFRNERSPRVHVGVRRQGDEWLFAVRDNGIGFDPQYAERIFVIFQRLNTRDRYEGSGIGLAICKKIIERMGGRIWVETSPGEGSTFFFTLPATAGEARKAAVGAGRETGS